MRLRTKLLMFSVGGGVVIAAVLMMFPDALDFLDALPSILTTMLLWPVAACEYLVALGPNMGSLSHPSHEATPLNVFAEMIGIALAWVFWSSVVFTVTGRRHRRDADVSVNASTL